MDNRFDGFHLLKGEIRKLQSAAKHKTGKQCSLGAYSFSTNSVNPDWLDITCEMDDSKTGRFVCDIKITCCMNDRRRSFTW